MENIEADFKKMNTAELKVYVNNIYCCTKLHNALVDKYKSTALHLERRKEDESKDEFKLRKMIFYLDCQLNTSNLESSLSDLEWLTNRAQEIEKYLISKGRYDKYFTDITI